MRTALGPFCDGGIDMNKDDINLTSDCENELSDGKGDDEE